MRITSKRSKAHPRSRMSRWTAIVLPGCCLLAGCQHVVYVHDASLGVNVNLSTQSGTAKLSVGYDRETFAVVPRLSPDAATSGAEHTEAEAMSLVSVSNVEAVGLEELTFNHAIATGEAAVKASQNTETLKAMRQAVFGQQGR